MPQNAWQSLTPHLNFLITQRAKRNGMEPDKKLNKKRKVKNMSPTMIVKNSVKHQMRYEENWDFACEYHPELLKLHADLRKLNAQIAFLFMAVIVEEKLYAEASQLAEHLEDQFLISKFSEDPDIKKIAKYAILRNEIKFAQDLNRASENTGRRFKRKNTTKARIGLSRDWLPCTERSIFGRLYSK